MLKHFIISELDIFHLEFLYGDFIMIRKRCPSPFHNNFIAELGKCKVCGWKAW